MALYHKVGVTLSYMEKDSADCPSYSTQPVLLEIQTVKVHGLTPEVMFDNGSTCVLVTHTFARRVGLVDAMVSYWLHVIGHDRVLRTTTLYTLFMVDNEGKQHGIDKISEESTVLDLEGVKSVFPGAPAEIYDRPDGEKDIIVESMYRNLQPFGGKGSYTRGRLRLVQSHLGCGFILSGTHPSIIARANIVANYPKTLTNCVCVAEGDDLSLPVLTYNRAVATLRIPEFLEAEELGVAPSKSCKRCSGCKDCSFRSSMISREKEAAVKRIEDSILYDADSCRVSVSYPWTEDVRKLSENVKQAIAFQSSIERKLLKDCAMVDTYNSELQKLVDRGAPTKLMQEEMNSYQGPVSYVSHLAVFKPDSATTPLRIVTNTRLKNTNAGKSPNDCMQEGPSALSSC